MTKEVEALGAIVTRQYLSERQICIFQRAKERSNNKNLFEIALGGEFQNGEQPEDVLIREMEEKTKLVPLETVYLGIVEIPQGTIILKRHIFLCTFPNGIDPIIDPKKHQLFEWKRVEDLNDFSNFIPGAKEILQKAGLA